MPDGLKNAEATYQRLVKAIFKDQNGKTMEVSMDDMLVKNQVGIDHVHHLAETFIILQKYQMKLNPSKWRFGANSSKFLSYLVISVKNWMFIKNVIFYLYYNLHLYLCNILWNFNYVS